MERGTPEVVEVTWGRAVGVWWALLWRLLALAAGPSVLIASVLGGIVAFLLVPYLASVVWWLFFLGGTALLSIPVVRWVLTVVILDGFAVRLVPVEEPARQERAASPE